MRHTTVIAESGSSAAGVLEAHRRLIRAAYEAGADVFKAQWVSNPQRLADRRHVQDPRAYQYISWPEDWHAVLEKECRALGLAYACTVYLPEDIEVVEKHVNVFKIASLESHDKDFVLAHEPYGMETLISTGLHDETTLAWLLGLRTLDSGWPVKLLQCTSAYPVAFDQTHLGVIRRLALDGFSDHTGNPFTGALAVAAGARLVEVHFRLADTRPDNPDYGHSLTPDGLKAYVEMVRMAERMLGDGVKRRTKSEEAMARFRVTP